MRQTPCEKLEAARVAAGPFTSNKGAIWGAFYIMGPCGRKLTIISDDGLDPTQPGWEHVSVSLPGRHPPNWVEMCFVKDLFWEDEETVLQFHPKKSEYKNCHPNCLHLWRNVGLDHPLPERVMV